MTFAERGSSCVLHQEPFCCCGGGPPPQTAVRSSPIGDAPALHSSCTVSFCSVGLVCPIPSHHCSVPGVFPPQAARHSLLLLWGIPAWVLSSSWGLCVSFVSLAALAAAGEPAPDSWKVAAQLLVAGFQPVSCDRGLPLDSR